MGERESSSLSIEMQCIHYALLFSLFPLSLLCHLCHKFAPNGTQDSFSGYKNIRPNVRCMRALDLRVTRVPVPLACVPVSLCVVCVCVDCVRSSCAGCVCELCVCVCVCVSS